MKRYRLLQSSVTPFGSVPAGTISVFKDDMYRFGDGAECFRLSEEDMIEQAEEKPDWFEEIKEPEGQEGEWHGNGDCSLCSCTDGMHFEPQEKEECKHFLPLTTFGLFGGPKYACRHCGFKWEGEKPQPKQKPSEWIKESANEVEQERAQMCASLPGIEFGITAIERSILDFLDSVAEGKYKL